MTSNPAFTERNIQKANAYLLCSRQKQKSLVTYHTLQRLYICVWLVNILTLTAPIGSPLICMWSPADICKQWERNLSFSLADVREAGMPDEPLRTSALEAKARLDKPKIVVRYKINMLLIVHEYTLFICIWSRHLKLYLRKWSLIQMSLKKHSLHITWISISISLPILSKGCPSCQGKL